MLKINLTKMKFPKIAWPKKFLFIEKWKFGKRYINVVIPLLCLGAIGTVTIGASSPLLLQLIQLRQNINVFDLQIKDYKDRLEQAKSLNKENLGKAMALLNRKFSPNYSLSYILNSLTELGNSLGVKFISINPASEMSHPQIAGLPGYALKVLPIEINLQSEYRDFGEFMDSLSRLPDCLIAIKGYTLSRDENILPRLNVKLELAACVLKGEKEKPEIEGTQEAIVQEEGK